MRSYEEIKLGVNLCDENGYLNDTERYWSRRPIINCNIPKKYRFRIKRWNYWTISNERYFFTIAVTNFDYAGVVFVYLVDMEKKNIVEKYVTIPLGKGIILGDNIQDELKYESKNLKLTVKHDEKSIILDINVDNFRGNEYLKGKLALENPKESLNLIVPWSKNRFQFTSKQNCLKVSGSINIGSETIKFDDDKSLGALDFGRGVWKRKMMWNWLSFSTSINDRLLGGNFGGTWTDGSGINENAVFLDGKVFKLKEDIKFIYDINDFNKPWKIYNKEKTVDLEFYPEVERIKKVNVIMIKSDFKQFFGTLKGKIIVDGEEIKINNVNATCEEHFAKW